MGRQIKRSDDGREMGDGTVSFAARDRTWAGALKWASHQLAQNKRQSLEEVSTSPFHVRPMSPDYFEVN
jgi:hypothetical protein